MCSQMLWQESGKEISKLVYLYSRTSSVLAVKSQIQVTQWLGYDSPGGIFIHLSGS